MRFVTKLTVQLLPKELLNIYNLKNSKWNYGIKSQKKWFEENINDNDIHCLLKNNNNIIAYNCLRFIKVLNYKKKVNYLIRDTLIAKKNINFFFLKKFIEKTNKVIKKKSEYGFLFCPKNLIKLNEIFGWNRLLYKPKVNFLRNKNLYAMTNSKYFIKKNIILSKI